MGSAGKESREKEIRHVSNLNEADHLGSFIRWRDDCEIFATSVPTPKGRRIRIYSRDGTHIRNLGRNEKIQIRATSGQIRANRTKLGLIGSN